MTPSDDSFVAQIRRLDAEKEQLEKELQAARDKVEEMREEKENLMSLLDKSSQQVVQWKSEAEHYRDFAVAIDRMLRSLNTNNCRSDDSVCVENLCGPLKE